MQSKTKTTQIEYPVRINRYLYLKNICSRRMADKLITQGQVHINGKVAKLGEKVNSGDKVVLGKDARDLLDSYKYFIYNKPVGVVSHNPKQGEKSAVEDAGLSKDFAPVGRLDKASNGLMLLTNDGRIVNKVLNPDFGHKRTYIVQADKPIKNIHVKVLAHGVNIEGYTTKPAIVKRISDDTLQITLTEGKKHQLRRMLAAVGYTTKSLKRISMLNLQLDSLKPSQKRELTKEEVEELHKEIGML